MRQDDETKPAAATRPLTLEEKAAYCRAQAKRDEQSACEIVAKEPIRAGYYLQLVDFWSHQAAWYEERIATKDYTTPAARDG